MNRRNFWLLLILLVVFGLSRFGVTPPSFEAMISVTTEQYGKISNLVAEEKSKQTLENPSPSLIEVPDLDTNFIDDRKIMEDFRDDEMFKIKSTDCPNEEWNNVHLQNIPEDMSKMHSEWRWQEMGYQRHYLYQESPSIFAAYVYKTHIVATLTAENYYARGVYCRYYDCNRNEIPAQFKTYVFPESTVHCARRKGAKYLSITDSLEVKPDFAVPIQKRMSPKHYFTVCMAPLYGDEPKFLQIVDFVEYHKLQGAQFFHIYIRKISDYDRVLLDDYARTREIEVIKVHDHYWREDFMWHHIEINDCLHRNKYFSKWTAFIDIDERIEIKDPEIPTVAKYLDTITNPNINALHLSIQWVLKNESTPSRYVNEQQIANELVFRKYHNTSQIGSLEDQPKCIIRPERIAVMDIHWPYAAYKGDLLTPVDKSKAIVRHYRNTSLGSLYQGNLDVMYRNGPFNDTSIDEKLSEHLTSVMTQRVKYVYDIKEPNCEQKKKIYANYNVTTTCV